METFESLTSPEFDTAPVFGELDDDEKERVLATLRGAESKLAAARDEVGLSGQTLALALYPSGQTELTTSLKSADGKVAFEASLRPRNFFSETPWRPGRPPRSMVTDAWDVEGAVRVTVRRLVGTHKYWIQEAPEEIEEQRYETAADAAAAYAAIAERLAEPPRSREATAEAWAPPEPTA